MRPADALCEIAIWTSDVTRLKQALDFTVQRNLPPSPPT
jgi:hypothetical protein